MFHALDAAGRQKVLPSNTNFSNPLAVANGGTGLTKIGDGELYVPTVASAMATLARSGSFNWVLAKAAAETSPSWYDLANILGPYYLPQTASRPWTAPRVLHFSASSRGSITGNTVLGGNGVVLSGTGTASDGSDATGAFLRTTSGAVSGNLAGVQFDVTGVGSNGQVEFNQELTFVCKFRTGSDITNVRIQVGIGNSMPNNSDTPSSRQLSIRYSTPIGDTAWVAVAGDGTAVGQRTFGTGVSIAASTTYTLVIRTYPATNGRYSADVSINGATLSFSIPDAALFNTGPSGFCSVITQTTAAKVIDISRMVLVARHNDQLY